MRPKVSFLVRPPPPMTEYDYSPEAIDAYMQKQEKISRWVDNTLDHRRELRNPFTPATPAVHALGLHPADESDDESEYPRRHTKRRDSKDDYLDRKERNRDRERELAKVERERERAKDRHFSARRHRSASVDASVARPTYKSPPPPLPIPPYPTTYPQQYYPPPKLTSPRNSQHSSRTSTTAFQASPTSYYPQQQAPYYNPVPPTYRTQSYPYSPDSKYPHTAAPYYQNGGYPQFDAAVRSSCLLLPSFHTHPSHRTLPNSHIQPTRQDSLLFSSASFRVSRETSISISISNLCFNLQTNGGREESGVPVSKHPVIDS